MSEWRCGPECPFWETAFNPYMAKHNIEAFCDCGDGKPYVVRGNACGWTMTWWAEKLTELQGEVDRLIAAITARKAQEPQA